MPKSTIVLGAISIICAGGALWSWRQLGEARRRVDVLEQQLAARAEPAVRSRDRVASPPATSPASPAAGEQGVAKAPAATQRPDAKDYVRLWQQREQERLRDPAYREMAMSQGRRQFARTRADAIRVVGMTAAQADQVIDLWVARNLQFVENGLATGQQPTAEQEAQIKRNGEAEQAKLRELLGADKYERWNWYLASGQERAEVDQFRSDLSASAEPLQLAQSDALVEAIYSERQRLSREYDDYAKSAGIVDRNAVSADDREHWLDLARQSNQRIHDAMANTLTSSQLQSLDQALAARLAPSEEDLRLQREGRLAKTD